MLKGAPLSFAASCSDGVVLATDRVTPASDGPILSTYQVQSPAVDRFAVPCSSVLPSVAGTCAITGTGGWTALEHDHRYCLARDLVAGLDVLDISSGGGCGAALLACVARSVVGLEIDQIAVRRGQAPYDRPNLLFLQGDATRVPLPDACVDAVVCLGCVIKGETRHDEYINSAVANGLATLGVVSGLPVVFGLLTTDTLEQATDRAGGHHGNKGVEAAYTALRMARLRRTLSQPGQKIGF